MSKRSKKSGYNKAQKTPTKHKKTNNKKAGSWAARAMKAVFVFSVIGLLLGSFYVYSKESQKEHDLSVVGNGIPSVVQIHDPSCPLCNQLKRNLGEVKGEFDGVIQFKTANLNTNKGQSFGARYGAGKVTLLFFDGRGVNVGVIQGVTSPEDLKVALTTLASADN